MHIPALERLAHPISDRSPRRIFANRALGLLLGPSLLLWATPASRSAPAPYLVPGEDVRAVSSAEALGPLGRATLDTSGDDIVLDCAPGIEPAGLAFATARMPPIPGMALRVVHTSDRNFRIVV